MRPCGRVTTCLVLMASLIACRKHDEIDASAELVTLAERTDYRETGRYDEVTRLCRGFEQRFRKSARCTSFGTTPEGRPMWAIVASRTGVLDAKAAHLRGMPVVLVQAGIHAGEIDGKEAGFQLLREQLEAEAGKSWLERVVVVFVPVFNVDGHELRSPYQRPNQNGPVDHGSRTTAQRYNLNRQYMIADAPEMQAMLGLLEEWDPILYVDLHVTDGARFQHDVSLSFGPDHYGHPELVKLASALREESVAAIAVAGHKPIGFYPRLKDVDDPGRGFVHDVDSPRHSEAYWGLRNRFGVLVEDHSWHDFGTRVKACKDTVRVLLGVAARHGSEMMTAARLADESSAGLGGSLLTLEYDTYPDLPDSRPPSTISFLGYAYEVFESAPVTGGRGLVYDPSTPQTWRVPYYDDVRPVPGTTVQLPHGGYLVRAPWATEVAARLKLHGVVSRVLRGGLPEMAVEAQRIDPLDVEYEPTSHQGRQRTRLPGTWTRERQTVEAGALFVPIAQPRALVAAHLLEPQGPDSLASWGLFNAAYERSDYMARYRSLELARWMHDGDTRIAAIFGDVLMSRLPALRQAFDERLQRDPEFAADPGARLDFWMRELPSDDPMLGLYPVLRIDGPVE